MAKKKFIVDAAPLVENKMSGVSHALAGLLDSLLKISDFQNDFEVILVVPRGRKERLAQWDFAKQCSIKQIPVPMKIINGLIKYKLLPQMDLLLGRGVYFFPNFRNWPLSKKSYSYTTIHDICFALFPEFVQPRNQQMLIKKVPLFIKQTSTVIAVSETSKQEIKKYYRLAESDLLTVPNAYDPALYKKYSDKDVAAVKKKYHITKNYLLFVGNIEPRKNLERLIEAYLLIPDILRKQYALVLVGGDGWLNEEIFKRLAAAQQAGESIIKPQVYVPDQDVAALLSGASALVHPALHEGFGMPPLEALASDTPVVASDIPSLKEVLGVAALYFDPLKVESIAQALEKILSDTNLSTQLVKKGQVQRDIFTWEKSSDVFYRHMRSHTLK